MGWVQWLTLVTPALWEAKTAEHKVRSSRPAWKIWWNLISTKNTKISQVWWRAPVVPATWEAEAGESLEPGKWRLQWAEITPLHSSLVTMQDFISKTKQNKNEGFALLDFKTYWKPTVIKTLRYWHKDRHKGEWNRIKNSEIYIYSEQIFKKAANTIQWKNDCLFNN